MDLSKYNEQVREAKNSFALIKEGWIELRLLSMEEKDSSKGGKYINASYETPTGQRLWEIINTVNSNEKAVNIGMATLKSLYSAVGVDAPQSPDDLVDIPFMADIKHVEEEYNGEKKTKEKIKRRVSKEVYQEKYASKESGADKPWLKK